MSKIRLLLITSIVSLGGVLILPRIGVSFLPPTGFGSSFAIIITLAIIFGIALPVKWRFPLPASILLWVAVYLASIAVWNTSDYFNVENASSILIELITLIWFTTLGYLIGRQLFTDNSQLPSSLSGIEKSQLPGIEESQPIIRAEITRGRHYRRPLSVFTIAQPDLSSKHPNTRETAQHLSEWLSWKLTKVRLVEIIRRELRAMDVIMLDKQTDRLILLCPEVDIEGAQQITNYLKNAIRRDLGIHIELATATFPDEALTFDGLLEQAYNRLNNALEPSPFNSVLVDGQLQQSSKK